LGEEEKSWWILLPTQSMFSFGIFVMELKEEGDHLEEEFCQIWL
jgi:hypothetical protein